MRMDIYEKRIQVDNCRSDSRQFHNPGTSYAKRRQSVRRAFFNGQTARNSFQNGQM